MGMAILNLISSTLMTGFAFIGLGTIINKSGKFLKIINEHKNDGFKSAFDSIMLDTIEECNKCVESVSLIAINTVKITILLYDILIGNKHIKKDKDGKIIVINKSRLHSGYKSKINDLTNKVKKYEEELNKIKKVNNEDDSSDNSINEVYSDISSDSSEEKDNDDFFLEE